MPHGQLHDCLVQRSTITRRYSIIILLKLSEMTSRTPQKLFNLCMTTIIGLRTTDATVKAGTRTIAETLRLFAPKCNEDNHDTAHYIIVNITNEIISMYRQ